jgi:hypothetical protein
MTSQYVGSARCEVRFERRHMTSVIAAHRRVTFCPNADLSLVLGSTPYTTSTSTDQDPPTSFLPRVAADRSLPARREAAAPFLR